MENPPYRSLLKPCALCVIVLSALSLPLEILAKQTEKSDSPDEVVQFNSGVTFKVRTDLVVVHVVVRDSQGKVVADLKKEDFQLFDNHKLQIISNFSVETPGSKTSKTPLAESESSGTKPVALAAKGAVFPQKFIALYFDDLHLPISGVAQSIAAARKLLEQMKPSQCFGVFTSSGHVEQDFTDDNELLNTALLRIAPQPVQRKFQALCAPQMSYYEAYEIAEVENAQVLQVVMEDFALCPGSLGRKETLEREVRAEAQQMQHLFSRLIP